MVSDLLPSSLSAWRFFILSAIAVAAFLSGYTADTSAATLDGTMYDLRLVGHVQNATGTQFSTEGYEVTTEFDAFFADLPNTIVPTPDPPFEPGNTLRVSETEAGDTAIIWIRGPNGGPDTFVNMLNPDIDVELDLTFEFDELGPLEKVAITDVRPENGSLSFYDPVSWMTSGLGTSASPLQLSIRLDPADIQGTFMTSHVKVHIDFMEMIIPEPATATLAGLAVFGLVGLSSRRHLP